MAGRGIRVGVVPPSLPTASQWRLTWVEHTQHPKRTQLGNSVEFSLRGAGQEGGDKAPGAPSRRLVGAACCPDGPCVLSPIVSRG